MAASTITNYEGTTLSGSRPSDVFRDVDAIIQSAQLCDIYRFQNARFWDREKTDLEYATRIQGRIRLESVADHSWHLADTILLIGWKFQPLDVGKCLMHAILHDKLEIITSDTDPIGRNGIGNKGHAFNTKLRDLKDAKDRIALTKYLSGLDLHALEPQQALFEEYFSCQSREAKFVKALDKLDPLVFILRKKNGALTNQHLRFSLRYAKQAVTFFPELYPYWVELSYRILESVARARKLPIAALERVAVNEQLEMPL